MKSPIRKAIYAGLGLVSDGTDAIKHLVRELAKKANVSEVEGEKVARRLEVKSRRAVSAIRRRLDAEVTMVADAIHAAMREDLEATKSKAASTPKASSKKPGNTKARTVRAGSRPVRAH
jgi:polyhydroxyalkanoate synthesis regulator phasin